MTYSVDFEPIGRRVEVAEDQTLLEAARRIVLSETGTLAAPCGGKGLCGRCSVRILEGPVSPMTPAETKVLTDAEIQAGMRLACQVSARGPLRVQIPPESLTGRQDLQTEAAEVRVPVDPVVRRYAVAVLPSTIEYPFSIWQQVVRALETTHCVAGAGVDPALLHTGDCLATDVQPLTVSVRAGQAIALHRVNPAPRPLGLAVDLGTTKIAGFLVDLETGETLASEASMNPQISYGEDLMSRLMYSDENAANARRMAVLARECIAGLLASMLERTENAPVQVEDAVIVGNTAMHHLFLELPVRHLGRSPYIPVISTALEVRARDLGFSMAPGAMVYLAPSIAGFVGGDHVAMILGSRIHAATAATLGIDIGTNTEIVLATSGYMMSCSCASGPAFEGAHIRHGMRAVEGAIGKVAWDENRRQMSWETIGGARPLGLCGSGVLDAVAALLKAGIIHRAGGFDRSHPAVRPAEKGKGGEYVIVPESGSGAGHDITITQEDIVAIQLAKSAIASGIQLLLAAGGVTKDDLAQVIVAGAFGSRIDLESAMAVGMVPDLPVEKFVSAGNAAGSGARLMLISRAERTLAERIAQGTKYLELTTVPAFSGTFARALKLSPI